MATALERSTPDAGPRAATGAPAQIEPKPAAPGLSAAVRTVSGVTLLSRVGGLIRDILIVRIFGSSPAVGSAFTAAFAIPNMFRRLLGEGALSAAFIPAYTAAQRDGRAGADRLASLTLAVLGLVAGAVTLLVELVILVVLLLIEYEPQRDLSLKLIMVMMPFMPLICMAAILAGMLQVHGRFGPANAGPLILNTLITAVGVVALFTDALASRPTAYALGAATVLSGVTQVLWFRKLLRPHVRWRRDWRGAVPAARQMMRKFVPVAIGLGTLQLNALIDTFIAMYPIWFAGTIFGVAYPLDGASNIILSQTMRLYQFPLGVFGIAVATAVFPMLARLAGDPGRFLETLRRGLRLSLFIGLPASLGLILIRHDVTAVLFGRVGASTAGFDDAAVARAAAVLLGFAPGVWAYSLNHVLMRAFYALGDTRTPMRVALGAVLFNLALNLTLIWPLGEAGLAWATSLSAMAQTGVLLHLLRGRLSPAAPVRVTDRATGLGMARAVAASLVMALCVGLLLWGLSGISGFGGSLLRLGGGTVVGTASYVLACKFMRVEELRWLFSRAPE